MTNSRDKKGRFAPGNSGGPGRPRLTTESAYLRMLADKCTPEIWGEIVDKAIGDAKGGNHRARAWLSRYLIGDPVKTAQTLLAVRLMDHSGVDVLCYEKAKEITELEDNPFNLLGSGDEARRMASEVTSLYRKNDRTNRDHNQD